MKLQFDGETSDINQLTQELKATGVKIKSITASRWRGENDEDKGGRIDVEIEDDAGEIKPKLTKLESEMNKNNSWTKTPITKQKTD